jgi:hypothetical protein
MFRRLRRNWHILKQALAAEAVRYEAMPYEDLLRPAEELSVTREVGGAAITFSAEAVDVDASGTIHFFIDASGLPTLLGIKPAYQFKKRPDGSVYY